MDWAWDDGADDRVNELWILMKELSVCRQVVYSKWFRDRGTFFSNEVFVALISAFRAVGDIESNLFPEARLVYKTLQENSPLSTKELKEETGLKGAFFQSTYNKALRVLYRRGLIVSFGEKDDGVFPSAQMGATSLIFEDLWRQSFKPTETYKKRLLQLWKEQPSLKKQFDRTAKELRT